jgi:hypothetical protein
MLLLVLLIRFIRGSNILSVKAAHEDVRLPVKAKEDIGQGASVLR